MGVGKGLLMMTTTRRVQARSLLSIRAFPEHVLAKSDSVDDIQQFLDKHCSGLLRAMIQITFTTLCQEGAYAMPFQNSQERNTLLPRYLSIYKCLRQHPALSGLFPQQRLNELLC
jgi:hypothetical protein